MNNPWYDARIVGDGTGKDVTKLYDVDEALAYGKSIEEACIKMMKKRFKELLAKHSRNVVLADQVPRPFISAEGLKKLLEELG